VTECGVNRARLPDLINRGARIYIVRRGAGFPSGDIHERKSDLIDLPVLSPSIWANSKAGQVAKKALLLGILSAID
jgi:hypothetical protein